MTNLGFRGVIIATLFFSFEIFFSSFVNLFFVFQYFEISSSKYCCDCCWCWWFFLFIHLFIHHRVQCVLYCCFFFFSCHVSHFCYCSFSPISTKTNARWRIKCTAHSRLLKHINTTIYAYMTIKTNILTHTEYMQTINANCIVLNDKNKCMPIASIETKRNHVHFSEEMGIYLQ